MIASGEKRRVALIGTGHRGSAMWGKELLAGFRESVDLVGLADKNSMRVERARVAIGTNAPAFTELGAMLSATRPETLIVCTRDDTHADIIVAALEAGVDVAEAKRCVWSGRQVHPSDIRVCELIGLPVHFEFASDPTAPRLQPLIELLDGVKRTADESRMWDGIAEKLTKALRGGRCQIDASTLAPDGQHLAVSAEVRTLLGWRVQRAGLVYSLHDQAIVGRVALGKLESTGWHPKRR